MPRKTSTNRGKALKDRRQAEGWDLLRVWLPPEAAAKLKQIQEVQGKSRIDVISALLSDAPV